jgi:hypothetical protein
MRGRFTYQLTWELKTARGTQGALYERRAKSKSKTVQVTSLREPEEFNMDSAI